MDRQLPDDMFSHFYARIASAVLTTAIPSVRPSVRLSVRPSHAGIVLKRRHVARFIVKDYGNVPGWRDFVHAQRAAWSLTQGHTLFCQITPF